MKVIFIFWNERINLESGGVHRVIKLLLEKLPQKGYTVNYLYTKDDYKTFFHYKELEEKENLVNGDNLRDYLIQHRCDIILGQDAVFSTMLSSIVKDMNMPNIKYVTEFHNSALLIPKVFTINRIFFEIGLKTSLKNRVSWGMRLLTYPIWKNIGHNRIKSMYSFNYNVADKTLLLTNREKTIIKKIVGDSTKCIAIPNPLSWEKIEDTSIIEGKKKEVLIVSRIYNPEKRIDLALKIWKLLEKRGYNDWILKIVGSGVHEEYLKKMTNKLGLKNVSWEGRQVSYPYYRTASLFMMTSACEGWGLTLTESLQTGTVPLAFDSYPALHDIITDGYDGCIIKNNDIEAYANKMEWLMTHADERKQMALNGLKSAQRFTINKIMDQWVEMIESL